MVENALQERHDHLVSRMETAKMQTDISMMEAALGEHGQNMHAMEWGTNFTPAQKSAEIGFADARNRTYSMGSDRVNGRFSPFMEELTDLAFIRALGRYYANTDATGVGIKDSIVNYVVGEGFTYDVKKARPDAPESLVQRVSQVVEAFLGANDWCSNREEKPVEEAITDGEIFLVLRAHDDGIPRIRIRTGEHFVEPHDAASIEEWSGLPSLDWSFGVGTPWGESEAPVAYFAQWYGEPGAQEILSADVVEHIKLNVPEDVKRGISDYYAAFKELDRSGKGILAALRGAGIQATIAMIEKTPPGATSDDISAALSQPGLRAGTVSGPTGTYPVTFGDQIEGRIVKTSGKDIMYGPMGSPSGNNLTDVFQAGLRRVAARWGLTEWMVSGDASNNNMASSVVAESPMNRAMKRRQRKFSCPYIKLIWKALAIMHGNGAFEEFDLPMSVIKKMVVIEATGDEPAERDQLVDEGLREKRHNAGILSLETWSNEIGYDLEEEQERGAKPQPKPSAGFGFGELGSSPDPREDQTTTAVMQEALEHVQTVEEAKAIVRHICEHEGPGNHPSGSSQDVHGSGGGGSDSKIFKAKPAISKKKATDRAATIVDQASDFADYLADDSAEGDGLEQQDKFKSSVESTIKEMAEEHGLTVTSDYDGPSTYWDITAEGELDNYGSFQVRASNHKQKYGGPKWSFEPYHDEKLVKLGIESVDTEMRKLAQSALDEIEDEG